MARPIQASISTSALRHNYAVAKRAALQAKVFAVVKANAYGHGVERVARALVKADGFAIVEIEGALAMREVSRPAKPLDFFFKINTGMNRLGFPVPVARRSLERLQKTGAAKSIT